MLRDPFIFVCFCLLLIVVAVFPKTQYFGRQENPIFSEAEYWVSCQLGVPRRGSRTTERKTEKKGCFFCGIRDLESTAWNIRRPEPLLALK